MSLRVERPYWVNWLHWNFYYRPFKKKTLRRTASWDFIRRVRRSVPGSLVLDCGANVGKVTAAFRRAGLVVHAFEPDPWAQAQFRKRFAGDPDVVLHPVGVGAEAGHFTLHRSPDFDADPARASIGSSLFAHHEGGTGGGVEVEVVDLVAFIRGLPRPVALLKLDVEGAEVAILERMIDEGLHREIGSIYVETHERFSDEIRARTEALRRRIAEKGITNINLDWQ